MLVKRWKIVTGNGQEVFFDQEQQPTPESWMVGPFQFSYTEIEKPAAEVDADIMYRRRCEYPSFAEFLEAYFTGKEQLDKLKLKFEEVKVKYPKP